MLIRYPFMPAFSPCQGGNPAGNSFSEFLLKEGHFWDIDCSRGNFRLLELTLFSIVLFAPLQEYEFLEEPKSKITRLDLEP